MAQPIEQNAGMTNNAPTNGAGDVSSLLQGGQTTGNTAPIDSGEIPQQDPAQSAQYKQVLDALMSKVKSKFGQLNSLKFAGDNQNLSQRSDLLKVVFDAMSRAGINPADADAINEFLAELQQQNPDLYALFIEALNGLLGPEQIQQQAADMQWMTAGWNPPGGPIAPNTGAWANPLPGSMPSTQYQNLATPNVWAAQ